MKTSIWLYLLIFTLCAASVAARADERNSAATAATLSGRITPGAPGVDVSNIEVYAVDTTSGDVRQTTTNAQGQYAFPNLTTGVTQQVSPARIGYGFSPAVRFIQHNGETANVDFAAFTGQVAVPAASHDFDGDGLSDPTVFRPSAATWFIAPSAAQENPQTPESFYGVRWGVSSDVLTPADFDGDGKTDVAVWRATNAAEPDRAHFYILNSSNNSVRVEQFGSPGDLPFLAGDWDGDGKADPAVYRGGTAASPQSHFYYRPSASPGVDFHTVYWGTTGDRPARGDFDGDGKLDAAVMRPSNGVWYIRQSSNDESRFVRWGLATDRLVPADYDGDGATDPAVYRDGTWYILQSSDETPRYVRWGLATDTLIPADYDGDGRADAAVKRGAIWYILSSASGKMSFFNFGSATDFPAQAAYFSN